MEVALAKKLQHRQLMLQISHGLSGSDLGDLKYLCGDVIAEAALEEVKTATDLFTLLQYHGQLSPGCYSFMSIALSSIGRNDLASELPAAKENSFGSHCDILPKNDCKLKHRMMLVAVADRMRREDIIKLMFVTSGRVGVSDEVTNDAIGALQVLAGLEESNLLCCSGYSDLCDLLQQIGRSDLADLVVGFPRSSLQAGFTMQNQALGLMMEVLRNKRRVYVFHQEKLGKMKDGNHKVIGDIHSMLQGICEKGLSSRNAECCTPSTMRALQSAFDSQYQFLECIVSGLDSHHPKHKDSFNFVNNAFGRAGNHKTMESHVCPVAESAHQTRRFILEVSSEIIGKEKATEVHQLNDKIENGINICSGYGKHVISLLSGLANLLSSVSEKKIRIDSCGTELMDIFTSHKKYLVGTFPTLAPHIQSVECLEDFSKISQTELPKLTTLPSTVEGTMKGLVAMVMVPSYAILLNLLCSLTRHVNSEEVLGDLVTYVRHSSHVPGSKEFVQRCASALYNHVACFQQDIMKLDDLCTPLITELINPNKGVL